MGKETVKEAGDVVVITGYHRKRTHIWAIRATQIVKRVNKQNTKNHGSWRGCSSMLLRS